MEEPAWEFLQETKGIRLYRRDLPGTDIDEFKGNTVINAGIEVVGRALQDVLAYPDWMSDCQKIRLVEKFDDQNFILYQVQKTPWPLAQRDAVVSVATTVRRDARSFTVRIKAVEDRRIPPQPNCVRITELTGTWQVASLDVDHTEITYSFTADPGGLLPLSLVNGNLQNVPYTTLRGLQRIVHEPAFARES
jgi:ribosome-associated toxin RatA of RatAB toxin-antitoxin module